MHARIIANDGWNSHSFSRECKSARYFKAHNKATKQFFLVTFVLVFLSACSHQREPNDSLYTPTPIPAHTFTPRSNRETLREIPGSADAFVDSIGVSTHLFYNGTPYVTKYPQVRASLAELHIRHLRDGLAYQKWQGYYDHLEDLAAIGIHDDLTANVDVPMSVVVDYLTRLPTAIEFIEGPNEYGGRSTTLLARLRAYQTQLYTTIKSRRSTPPVSVVGPSFTSYEACMLIGNIANVTDYGNMHDYFSFRNPGTAGWGNIYPGYGEYGSLKYNLGIVKQVYRPRPIIATETGWDDGASYQATTYSVTPAVKARYTMRVILEHWNAGIKRTYIYELIDEGRQSFGLLKADLTKKPVYIALRNLMGHLTDSGPATTRLPITYQLLASADVHHTLLEKRDSSYQLLLWVETPARDPGTPARLVQLSIPKGLHITRQYAWRDDGSVMARELPGRNRNSVSLLVTDRVTEIDFSAIRS